MARFTWYLSGAFLILTIGTAIFLTHELGLFSFARVEAAENTEAQKADGAKKTAGIESLARAIAAREASLDQREAELKKREHVLAEKEALLTKQMESQETFIGTLRGKVTELEDALRKKGTELESAQDKRNANMRQIYEKMEPKQAARILATMETELADSLLEGMKKDRAAEILARIPAERAKLITEKAVGKKVSSPPPGSPEK